MRIGLYGMPTAGKTYIMDRIDFIDVLVGSRLLREYDPDFDTRDEEGREHDRKAVAELMMKRETFIMDGDYAFGDEVAFTEEEGEMYDVYLYLYVDPTLLRSRMQASEKNRKYLRYDIAAWQQKEISGLREYCHKHNKDFYVIDNPPENGFSNPVEVVDFIRDIVNGYSCVGFAKKCADEILNSCEEKEVILLDGDKTLTIEDSSGTVFGYKTHLYDGNFYTGYQAWKQNREFQRYEIPEITSIPVHLNETVLSSLNRPAYILTSGHEKIWRFISNALQMRYFCGIQMSAETKLYITKFLQDAGISVIAYGDGMNDYYMLKQANKGFLVAKQNGSVSRSLKGKNLEGLTVI